MAMDRLAVATSKRLQAATAVDRREQHVVRRATERRNSEDRWRALRHFGISADAEQVWRSLLAEPEISRHELERMNALSAERVEQALNVLVDAQLARRSNTKAGVSLVDPVLAIETHIARHERKLAQQAEQVAELRCQLPELATQYTRGRASANAQVEIVMGAEDVRHQVYLAAERARFETRSLDNNPVLTALRHSREINFNTLGRGVQERSIFASAALSEPGVFGEIEELHRFGHHVRTLPDVPIRLLIYDTDLVVLPIDPGELSVGAMFIRSESLIATFIYMFDRLWAEADPLFAELNDGAIPSGRAARVLELMAIGTKDESIARSLGVGVRTIRRDVADLRSLLGVNSRAEIAAAAVRRGWL
jgi:DNA-binding CsgD family transcriptional regulator